MIRMTINGSIKIWLGSRFGSLIKIEYINEKAICFYWKNP